MKHIIAISIFLCSLLSAFSITPLKLLHMSFHKGCIEDFQDVSNELGLDTTNWYIQDAREKFDPEALGNDIYNITAQRADRVWNLNKDYFDQFDVIITSDTAPLARIFLQNNWKKPLIIWVCNRFDYCDAQTANKRFPDQAYYDLFRSAIDLPNVKIISYTPYEHFYADKKRVNIGTKTIRPIGKLTKTSTEQFKSFIPESIDKSKTIFLYPRMAEKQLAHIERQCNSRGISTYCGTYNGPDDLTDFKAILYFPYAWSNIALFENIQRGIVHFVPSEHFLKTIGAREKLRIFTLQNFHLCDWYCEEFKDLFVYFDSWQDLKEKIETTNYESLSQKIKSAGARHRKKNLEAWQEVFNEITPFNVKAENFYLIEKAWNVNTMGPSAPAGKPSYYSMTINGVDLPGLRPWELRWDMIKDALDYHNKKILELGCCMGLVSTSLKKYRYATRVTGVDGTDKFLKGQGSPYRVQAAQWIAQAFDVEIDFIQTNLNTDAYESIIGYDYDIVFCLSLLHWIKDKHRLMTYLSHFDHVIFEGHQSDEFEIDRFARYGFVHYQILGHVDQGKTLIHFSKKKAC